MRIETQFIENGTARDVHRFQGKKKLLRIFFGGVFPQSMPLVSLMDG